MFGNVAIPSGAVYPDGLDLTTPDPEVQASVRPEGSYFAKSAGFASIRTGKTKFQHSHGMGIHFTPQRFAENVDLPDTMPIMVDSTARDHADLADLPGSENLTMDGEIDPSDAATGGGILMAEPNKMAPTGGSVQHAGRKTLPDMGDREPHRPLTQLFHGLAHPAQLFKAEYAKDPIIAIGAAALITGIAWSIGRDFEGSYRRRSASASSGGGVAASTAPVAAAPAAAVETVGAVVETAAETVEEVVETAAEAVETVTETVANTITE